jgi:hypothetical protein
VLCNSDYAKVVGRNVFEESHHLNDDCKFSGAVLERAEIVSLIDWQALFNAEARAETKFWNFAIQPCLFVLVERNRKFIRIRKGVLLLTNGQEVLVNLKLRESVGLIGCDFYMDPVLIKLRFVLLENPSECCSYRRSNAIKVEQILVQERQDVGHLHVWVFPKELENFAFEKVCQVFLG